MPLMIFFQQDTSKRRAKIFKVKRTTQEFIMYQDRSLVLSAFVTMAIQNGAKPSSVNYRR